MAMSARASKRLLFLLTVSLGLLMGGFSIAGLSSMLGAVARAAPVLREEPLASTGVVLSLFSFSIALICAVPDPRQTLTRREARRLDDRLAAWGRRWLVFAVCCLLTAAIARPVQHAVLDRYMRSRGYRPCPSSVRPRDTSEDWVLPGPGGSLDHCPQPTSRTDA